MSTTWFIAAAMLATSASGAFAASTPFSRDYAAQAGLGHYVAPGAEATLAPKKICKIKGTWTDTAGGTFKMKTNTTGKFTVPGCADAFSVTISGETKKGFNVSGTYGNDTDCVPTFTEVETFTKGSCTETTGTLTDENGSFEDDWTKTAKKAHVAPPANLTGGLK